MTRRSAILLLLATLNGPLPSEAQVIPIRTVPVASGDQFRFTPSTSMSMGGVRLAVDDSVADALSNPAKGIFIEEGAFFGSPTFYSIARRGGAGRTFPVTGLFGGGTWFGGATLALQQIENNDEEQPWIALEPVIDVCCFGCCGPRPGPQTLSEEFGRNLYASGFVGRRLSGAWSVGVGASIAQIGAMDGVDLLYSGSDRIEQSGSTASARLGLFRDGDRDRLSLLLLHGNVSMTHEVTYLEWIWNETLMRSELRRRLETNEDESLTWGGQVAWDRALTTPGWRIGASATMNHKSHPKLPNYTIQNIPRDPGTTWAYEAAVGFSKRQGGTMFAMDLALQPIWTETWQEADAQDVADSGRRLLVGDRSIENEFFFTNVVLRSGLSHRVDRIDFHGGLEIRSYAYQLQQVDYVDRTFREQDESWIEWSPTFGVLVRFDGMDLRYSARITTGTGRPGVELDRALFAESPVGADAADFILAPEGPLTLVDAHVTTHQLSVRIPIR